MSKKKSSLTKFYRRWSTRRGTQSHSSCSEPLPLSPPLRGYPSCRMVLEPRILLDASLVDTTSIEADPEQPTDLRFDVPGTRVSDPRLSDPRLSDPQDPQRMITPDLPTVRNWLDTANTHNARLCHCGQVVGRATRRPNLPCRDLQRQLCPAGHMGRRSWRVASGDQGRSGIFPRRMWGRHFWMRSKHCSWRRRVRRMSRLGRSGSFPR